MYTVYDRIFGNFPAKKIPHIHIVVTWFWATLRVSFQLAAVQKSNKLEGLGESWLD
jgi:hypothetical protein